MLSAVLLVASLLCALAGAQHQGVQVVGRLVPPRVLSALGIRAGSLQSIVHSQQAAGVGASRLAFRVMLAGTEVGVALHPSDVRAPGYQLLERTSMGLRAVSAGPCTTFRGGIIGDGNSRIAASLVTGILRVVIIRADGLWVVQPLSDVVPNAPSESYIVFHGSDCLSGDGHCGVAALASPPLLTGFPDATYECELALEVDHALFLLNNSNTSAAQSEVLGIVNAVDVIFQSGLTVSFNVTQLIVATVPDPYTSNNANALIGQMRSHWNSNYGGVTRDVAHLFTGRQVGAASAGTVGLAYTSTACDVPNAYALSQTRWHPNFALRVALTAHELGHNFGANHCDMMPFCNLMCSGIGGCSGVASSFSATAQAAMNAYLQTVNCLTLVPSIPQITSISPALLPTVNPPVVTLGGSGFLGSTSLLVGGQPLVGGFQVLSDTQLRFTPPFGLPIGVQPVAVSNPAGTSNASFLLYQGSNPCQVVAPIGTPGGAPFTWQIGGWPNDVGYLGVSLTNSTVQLQGFPFLTQFLTLWAGPLDARGMATVTVPVVPALLAGLPFYSQMLDGISGTTTVRSASLVWRTLIY